MTLPSGWEVRSLGDVAATALGKMLDRGNRRGLPEVRYLRNVNVQWDRIDTDHLLTMELADSERGRFAVEPGDLRFAKAGRSAGPRSGMATASSSRTRRHCIAYDHRAPSRHVSCFISSATSPAADSCAATPPARRSPTYRNWQCAGY